MRLDPRRDGPPHLDPRVARVPHPVHQRRGRELRERRRIVRGERLEGRTDGAGKTRRPDRRVRQAVPELGEIHPTLPRLDRVPRNELRERPLVRGLHPVRLRLHRVEIADPFSVPQIVDHVLGAPFGPAPLRLRARVRRGGDHSPPPLDRLEHLAVRERDEVLVAD